MKYNGTPQHLFWKGSPRDIVFDQESIHQKLLQTDKPCYVMKDFRGRIGVSNTGELVSEGRGLQVLAIASPVSADQLGDPTFRKDYNLKYNYKTGNDYLYLTGSKKMAMLHKMKCYEYSIVVLA